LLDNFCKENKYSQFFSKELSYQNNLTYFIDGILMMTNEQEFTDHIMQIILKQQNDIQLYLRPCLLVTSTPVASLLNMLMMLFHDINSTPIKYKHHHLPPIVTKYHSCSSTTTRTPSSISSSHT
jgi:hypothetical protein